MKRAKTKEIPDDLKERNSQELRALSEQLGKIIERTGEIEEHINALEISKNYREGKAGNKKKIAKKTCKNSGDDYDNELDLVMSETSPKSTFSKSSVSSQLAPFQGETRRNREPTLRDVLLAINAMRKNVSELATRQNEMKFELEKIRARLC